ncbi:2-C-methyl-D-erythritol 4-phosphate cytidylyltransferase [Planctomycetes bacterium K23_9]|uniref:2-C-methyl-D-erythritol 4-phosphate cytidylyltransferase n=1 Tax=Stieleria marina TaxID=1930275 RepID=A0A517NSB5_9BACT|nr:2-C-methyl-D-erythritol 4-phosphate cytidylyltransferase [Planctomycetes bacterium K23_9]
MPDPNSRPPVPGYIAAILPAGGSGQRFGASENKLFALLDGKPIWYHAAQRLRQQSAVGRIVMAVAASDQDAFANKFQGLVSELQIELVSGGKERTDSVQNGLGLVKDDPSVQYVAVHDAARPLVSAADLNRVFDSAIQTGAAILATPIPGSVKRSDENQFATTVDRRDLWIALTPQVFRIQWLLQAYEKYRGRPATDDAELVQRIGHAVTLVRGSAENIKITHSEDLAIAHAILQRQNHHA